MISSINPYSHPLQFIFINRSLSLYLLYKSNIFIEFLTHFLLPDTLDASPRSSIVFYSISNKQRVKLLRKGIAYLDLYCTLIVYGMF